MTDLFPIEQKVGIFEAYTPTLVAAMGVPMLHQPTGDLHHTVIQLTQKAFESILCIKHKESCFVS